MPSVRGDAGDRGSRCGSRRRSDRAADAIAAVRPPIPPSGNPHEPSSPSPTSPIWWWAITKAVPGERGPAHVPITPDTESTPSTSRRLEEVVEEIGDAHREQAGDVGDAAHAESLQLPRQPGLAEQVRRAGAAELGRDRREQRAEHVGQARGATSSQRSIASASAVENLAISAWRRAAVRGQLQRPAVGVGHEVRALGVHLVAVTLQLEVAEDRRRQQAHDVGQHRDLVVGPPRLLGDGGAADDGPAFEDHGALAGPGQVGAGHQPVVATPDDDGVVRVGGHLPTVPVAPSECFRSSECLSQVRITTKHSGGTKHSDG